jgi:hypothetical protein
VTFAIVAVRRFEGALNASTHHTKVGHHCHHCPKVAFSQLEEVSP